MEGPAAACFGTDPVFPDKRLDRRLGRTFNEMARRPGGTLPRKLVKRADLVGGYRMFNHDHVTHQAILQAHRAACMASLATHQGKVLLIHDTTVLDYSGLDVRGLGQVGDGHGKGLYAHNSLAVIPATRQVVGLMNQILHKRAHAPKNESKAQRQARPDRESRLWKRAVADLPPMPPGVNVSDVSDRGSDLSEYVCHEVQANRQFIVRSQHNRVLVDDQGERQIQKLHDRLRGLPEAIRHLRRRVPAKGGGWRQATIGLAWERVGVKPPRQARGEHGSEPIALWGVIAREVDTPADQEPVEWILLTNRPIESAEQALEVVEDYACRWMVEDYHKAMKSGCGIEDTQMTTLHGLSNVIALQSVLAVHVLRLRCNARDEQIKEQPARLHEEPLMVELAARDAKHADWKAMSVWEFHIAVAKMGGYMLNPRKRPPGWIVLWRGYTRLQDMCAGVRLIRKRCVQT